MQIVVVCIYRNGSPWTLDLIVIRMPWTPIPKLCVCGDLIFLLISGSWLRIKDLDIDRLRNDR